MFAAGFVIPAIVSVPAVLFARAQVPPELASVTVTTLLAPVPVAEQWENPLTKVIVGVAGAVKPALNVTMIVLVAASDPVEEVVKPSVQVAIALATRLEPEKVTEVGVVAAVITTAAPGLAARVSIEVATLKVLAAYEPAAGLVMPAIVSVPAVLFARAQVPPEFASVIVTTLLVVLAVAEQFTNPPVKAMVGFVGMVKPALNVAVTVLPVARAPVEELVRPTVQVVVALATWLTPEKVTDVGVGGGVITIADTGNPGVVSTEVATLKVLAAYEPAAGFVMPAMVKVPVVLVARAQVPCPSVTVTTLLVALPVAVQLANPPVRVMVGLAGMVKPELNVTVIVLLFASDPLEEVVKPTVQVAVALAT